jgi:Alkaline phosphatase PhoX
MRARALLAAAALIVALPASTSGAQSHPNPAVEFVNVVAPGGDAIALINSGQVFDGTTFEGIPDGLGIMPVGDGSEYIDIFVAFEQSHVPFGVFADHQDSSVQRARLNLDTQQIVELDEVLPNKAGFIRFCSANMVGPDQGFDDYTFLVNEESNDILPAKSRHPYGADAAIAPYRQAGYSVWLDAASGQYATIAGAGRMNHENTVVVPGGWSGVVALTGDDTFNAPSSQLYLYSAASESAFKQDQGSLWAFQVTSKNGLPVTPTDPFNGANDYLDIGAADTMTGTFISVPSDYARGTHGGQPQADLESWSNANNVFQFIRVEDIAYDPDDPRTVYFTDTGATVQPSLALTGPTAGRLISGGTAQNGRVFKIVLSAADPKVVDSFTVLADGNTAGLFTRPDNLAVGHDTLMLQEDASSTPNTNNDIWSYPLAGAGGPWTRVATVNQATAETSGIVDASEWLGDGWWIFDVQSHSTQKVFATDLFYTTPITGVVIGPYTSRRELGQLLLLHIPGS